MKARKRIVRFYDLVVSSRATTLDVAQPDCADMRLLIREAAKLPGLIPTQITKTSARRVALDDWRAHGGHYELLINGADGTLSDVAIRGLADEKILRMAGKQEDEGFERSCHVLVRPKADQRTALVLMTAGANCVSPQSIQNLMGKLTRRLAQAGTHRHLFEFPHPSGAVNEDGSPVTYRVRYRFECNPHRGVLLNDALNRGELVDVELVDYNKHVFDEGGNLVIESESVKLTAKVPGATTVEQIFNAARTLSGNQGAIKYDEARVRFKVPGRDVTQKTIAINDLANAFTLSEILQFDTDLSSHDTTVNDTIVHAMRPLLG